MILKITNLEEGSSVGVFRESDGKQLFIGHDMIMSDAGVYINIQESERLIVRVRKKGLIPVEVRFKASAYQVKELTLANNVDPIFF